MSVPGSAQPADAPIPRLYGKGAPAKRGRSPIAAVAVRSYPAVFADGEAWGRQRADYPRRSGFCTEASSRPKLAGRTGGIGTTLKLFAFFECVEPVASSSN